MNSRDPYAYRWICGELYRVALGALISALAFAYALPGTAPDSEDRLWAMLFWLVISVLGYRIVFPPARSLFSQKMFEIREAQAGRIVSWLVGGALLISTALCLSNGSWIGAALAALPLPFIAYAIHEDWRIGDPPEGFHSRVAPDPAPAASPTDSRSSASSAPRKGRADVSHAIEDKGSVVDNAVDFGIGHATGIPYNAPAAVGALSRGGSGGGSAFDDDDD